MGLFSKPSSSEVRGFGRGKTSSAQAAEEYARRAREREAEKIAARERAAERRAAQRKK